MQSVDEYYDNENDYKEKGVSLRKIILFKILKLHN